MVARERKSATGACARVREQDEDSQARPVRVGEREQGSVRGGERRSGSGGTAVCGGGAWLACLGELWVALGGGLVKDVIAKRPSSSPSGSVTGHVVSQLNCTSSSLQVHVVREKRRPAKRVAALAVKPLGPRQPRPNCTKELVKYVVLLAAGHVEQLLACLRHSCFLRCPCVDYCSSTVRLFEESRLAHGRVSYTAV